MFKRLYCVAFAIACFVLPHHARAQTAVLIVVQRSSLAELTACEQQLRSELIAEGYQPTTVQVTVDPNAAILVDTAKRLSSPAAIAISIRDGIVSGLVWMVDPNKPGGLLRAVTDYPLSEQTAAVFAVSTTDVLHGGLLELGYIHETPDSRSVEPTDKSTSVPPVPASPSTVSRVGVPEKPPPLAAVPTPPRDRKTQWQIQLGLESIVPMTNTPFAIAPNFSFARRLGNHFALGMYGHVTLPVTLNGTRGNADLSQIMGGPWLEYRVTLKPQWTLFPFVETGVHYASVRGRAGKPLTNYNSYTYTIYHHFGLGTGWNATQDFGAWLRVGLQLPWRPSNVIIVDETVAKVATTALIFGAGMTLKF